MLELLIERGRILNPDKQDLRAKFHHTSNLISIGDDIVIEKDQIKKLNVLSEEYEKDNYALVFADYGIVFGLISSISNVILNASRGLIVEASEILLDILLTVILFGLLGLVIGSFIGIKAKYLTFEIELLKDGSKWTIRSHKILFDKFVKFTLPDKNRDINVEGVSPIKFSPGKVSQEGLNTTSQAPSIIEKLEKYHELMQNGVISEDEFSEVKRKLFNQDKNEY